MAIGSMGALNIVSSAVSTAGSASGGASASSGQGGAGLGFNILGAPGDPGGVGYKMIVDARMRKEDKRRFDLQNELQSGLVRAQTESFNLDNMMKKRKMTWTDDVRKFMTRGF